MKRVLTFIGSGGHGSDVTAWRDFTFHHTGINYEQIVTHKGRADRIEIDLPKLDAALNAMNSGRYAAVFCETPEAMLFRFVTKHRKLKQLPFVVHGCDVAYRLEALNSWLKSVYNIDYMRDFLRHPLNTWVFTTELQRELFAREGIPEERLVYMPSSIRVVELLFPETARLTQPGAGFSPGDSEFAGMIAAPGNNNRDFDTLFEAIRGLDVRCAVIRDRRHYPLNSPPGNAVLYDMLPLDQYIAAVRDSLFVAIPMKSGNHIMNGGQITATYAARLGKACVATRCEAIEECVIHEKTGLLVDTGDAGAMRDAIVRLASDAALRRKMGKQAVKLECGMSEKAEIIWHGIFKEAVS